MSQSVETAQIEDNSQELEDFALKSTQKVALDIADAPFLQEDKPEEPPKEDEAASVISLVDEQAKADALAKRKKIIAVVLIALFLLILLFFLWFFVLREVPGEGEAAPTATVIVVPSPETASGPKELPINMKPFLVPQKDIEGKERFLRLQISSFTTNERLLREIGENDLVIRDAVYFYLRNKSHEYMLDPKNLPEIKQNLLEIINEYLGQAKLEDLLIENYLLR